MADHRFFQNRECEYFPCHPGVAEEDFNCLFCYCPLYALGGACGGNCTYSSKGYKSCAQCAFPHQRQHYDQVVERSRIILDKVRRTDGENQ